MKCLTCETEFEPKRSTAKFCSPACRVAHARGSHPKPTAKIFRPKISAAVVEAVESPKVIKTPIDAIVAVKTAVEPSAKLCKKHKLPVFAGREVCGMKDCK